MPVAVARAAIARLWLDDAIAEPPQLGAIVLRPHQREALGRLRRTLARHRVALLADDVGLGKTFVAVALARDACAPVIVGPAALRSMWQQSLDAAGVRARWISYERLSRSAMPHEPADLLILDEAQHARTPSTNRYARLAALASGARVLLLSATPIHNRRGDLTRLFALALGEAARSLDDAEIAARTVRRTHQDVPAEPLPAVRSDDWIRVPDDDRILDRLIALPPPLPPRDGGDGGALLAWTLVRLWASTRGALRAGLRRRVQRGLALRQALQSGVHPSAAELAAWQCSDRAVQLAFAEILAPPVARLDELLDAVERHLDAVEALRRDLATGDDPDGARAAALLALHLRTPGARTIVFTQFADSAAALWRLLRAQPGVAMLTSRGAEVASGRLSRREALRRFAPVATGAGPPSLAERISMLLSTDLLSEGVNLQDASIVVHLDLPWTHARLAQRVGRVRRMGSSHDVVQILGVAPPAAAERLLAAERRIAEKLGAASRTLGVAGAIFPSMLRAPLDHLEAPVRASERLRARVSRWRATGGEDLPPAIPVAAVRGAETGVLAAVRVSDGMVTLAAVSQGRIVDDPRTVHAVAAAVDAAVDTTPPEAMLRESVRSIERWARARAAERSAGGTLSIGSRASRAILRRVAATIARTPRARRSETAELAARARGVAGSAIGVGGELVLSRLAAAEMPDGAWLRAVAAFAEAHRADAGEPTPSSGQSAVLALIVLVGPGRPGRAPDG